MAIALCLTLYFTILVIVPHLISLEYTFIDNDCFVVSWELTEDYILNFDFRNTTEMSIDCARDPWTCVELIEPAANERFSCWTSDLEVCPRRGRDCRIQMTNPSPGVVWFWVSIGAMVLMWGSLWWRGCTAKGRELGQR